VENRLFKVPKHMFVQESQLFQTMLSLPVPAGTPADGSSDARPLKLDGVKAVEFMHLLRCLYPGRHRDSANADDALLPEKVLQEWLAVFKLAVMWEMDVIKTKAIRELTPLLTNKPTLQVKLAVESQVEEWLVPGLNKLVQREEPIDREDVNMIGLDFALKIMTLREDYGCSHRWSSAGNPGMQRRGAITADVSNEIRARFSIRKSNP
ncbi:hypothetical protein AMATHDRAFT_152243, partial [Amanita thiersii Skay4041]